MDNQPKAHLLDIFGAVLIGLLLAPFVVGLGFLLSLTGIGLILGVPLIIVGVTLPITAPLMITSFLCPVCEHRVTVSRAANGIRCKTCKSQLVRKDGRFMSINNIPMKGEIK